MECMRVLLRLFVLAATIFLSPIGLAMAQEPMMLPVDPAPLVINTDEGKEVAFKVEIADDGVERSRGLMFRKQMDADHGMLFVFEQQQPLAFWMKNTILPLDLVFIDKDGMVQAVLPGTPFSEAPISPRVPVQYVLELNQGTASRLNIDKGDKVRHPQILQTETLQ